MFHNAFATIALLAQLAAPADAYRTAVDAMRAIPLPAFVTYRAQIDPGDATIELTRTPGYYAKPRLAYGADFYYPYEWYAAYRSSDGLSRLDFGDGPAFSHLALFDPTWSGISVWMRRGLLGTLDRAPDLATPAPEPTPAAVTQIADVYAFDPSAYRVDDGGIAWCGTDPGRVLRLRATRDPRRHPLQRVTIDAVTGRICIVRFEIDADEDGARFDGYAELRYVPLQSYFLADESYIDVAVRESGRLLGYAHVRMHYGDERVWQTLPDAKYFTRPPKNGELRSPADDPNPDPLGP